MAEARVLSVNVALPRILVYRGRAIRTGIFKEPVEGRRRVGRLNVEGDGQADLSVHGGPDKAVYAYPAEHYGDWRDFLRRDDLPRGSLGENLTTEGLLEDSVHVGDVLRIGTTELVVTQPRSPCYKLAARFDRPDLVSRFLASGRSGFYLSVRREGDIGAGDEIEVLSRDARAVPIATLNRALRGEPVEAEVVDHALQIEVLPAWWRGVLRRLP